jgi:hypothetical protein
MHWHAGRVRRRKLERQPRFEHVLISPAPTTWSASVDAFNAAFDKRLALRRNDCETYVDDLLVRLTGVPLRCVQKGTFSVASSSDEGTMPPLDVSAW